MPDRPPPDDGGGGRPAPPDDGGGGRPAPPGDGGGGRPAPPDAARALAVAAVLAAGDDAPAVAARLAGADADAARAEVARLLALPRSRRAEALARAAVDLRAPRPAGLAQVHPSWLKAARPDDPRVAALAEAGEPPEVRAWAARLAYGALVAMPEDEAGPLRGPADLPRARPDWLGLRLERTGLRQLAHATCDAPPAGLAALAARLGGRGRAFTDAVNRLRALGAAAAERHGPRRAAQARCADADLAGDPLALVAIGARALAPHVAAVGGELPRQLAQRLPRPVGLRVLDELTAWRAAPLADAPAWGELAG